MLRNKKSLAFVLALVMMLTLIPASAFAKTTNSIPRTLVVAAETPISSVRLDVKVTDSDGFNDEKQTIVLSLENGKWNAADDNNNEAYGATTGSGMSTTYAAVVAPSASISAIDVVSLSDSRLEFSFTPDSIGKDETVSLYLNIESGADAGPVNVKIDGDDSRVDSGTYTVATVGDGNTIATVADKPKSVGRTSVTGATIEIREVAVNSIKGSQQLKLTLPKDVTWNDMINANNFAGSMTTPSSIQLLPATGALTYVGERDVIVSFSAIDDPIQRQVLTFKPSFKVGKDAAKGDIAVQVRNQMPRGDYNIADASGLVVATYGDENVEVTTVDEKKLPEIIAGRENKTDNTPYEVEVTLTENQTTALTSGRFVDFSFPEYVQVLPGVVEVKVNSSSTSYDVTVPANTNDNSSFEWLVAGVDNGKTDKVKFTIPVTVEANYTGDIELVVDGAKAGVSESKIVVGKAIAPFTVEVVPSNVKTGVQNQASGSITIKETVAGAIRDDSNLNQLKAWIDSNNQDFNFSNAKVEVKAGDLELKTKALTTSKGAITIGVERTSIKTPAEIVISDVQLTLNRTPAQGDYNLRVGGTAVVDNEDYNDEDFENFVKEAKYVTVVTPADQGVNATFKIGEKSYVSNGVSYTMDAAAYIDSANRTMVPIRYIANAMGVSEDQVVWNQATQTATIFGKNMVSIKVGSNVITSNGTPITMDTVAVNNAGRIFVPVRYVAYALGGDVSWDQATQTATIFTVK